MFSQSFRKSIDSLREEHHQLIDKLTQKHDEFFRVHEEMNAIREAIKCNAAAFEIKTNFQILIDSMRNFQELIDTLPNPLRNLLMVNINVVNDISNIINPAEQPIAVAEQRTQSSSISAVVEIKEEHENVVESNEIKEEESKEEIVENQIEENTNNNVTMQVQEMRQDTPETQQDPAQAQEEEEETVRENRRGRSNHSRNQPVLIQQRLNLFPDGAVFVTCNRNNRDEQFRVMFQNSSHKFIELLPRQDGKHVVHDKLQDANRYFRETILMRSDLSGPKLECTNAWNDFKMENQHTREVYTVNSLHKTDWITNNPVRANECRIEYQITRVRNGTVTTVTTSE